MKYEKRIREEIQLIKENLINNESIKLEEETN